MEEAVRNHGLFFCDKALFLSITNTSSLSLIKPKPQVMNAVYTKEKREMVSPHQAGKFIGQKAVKTISARWATITYTVSIMPIIG